MEKNYGLTNTEMELMEFLWMKGNPVTFKEIFDFFNNDRKKNWKKQTINTYLSNLLRSGMIGVDKSRTRSLYYFVCSKNELVQKWTKGIVEESFGNSISSLVAAFTGGKKLTPEEAERLKKMI